jgi:peptidoglycan/xylan/chitin deacetylase (PgdA/CDA1 family)
VKLGRSIRSRWLDLREGPGAAVLLYHRVAELPCDPQWLAVTPARFAEQMEVLRAKFHPLSAQEFLGRKENGSIPERAVVVTFDDGYADNFAQAEPILKKVDITATIFVVAGHLGTMKEFWWDELEGLLLTESAPDNWNVLSAKDSRPEHATYREWAAKLHRMAPPERDAALEQIAQEVGRPRPKRERNRVMTIDELRRLPKGGLIEIGAHTMTHTSLSAQAIDEQRIEITKSRQTLREIIGQPIRSFAYPFGTRGDYGTETVSAVEAAGFDCAFSNFSGLCRRRASRFELPRFLVRDWDGDQFERELNQFFQR